MDYFGYKNGEYTAEEVSLETIAAQVGTPFYCYSKATLERHYTVFSEQFSGLDAMVCYAVKANGNLGVLSTFAKLGAGADVVSEGEIRLALAAGMPANKIVFSGVGKTKTEMAYALEQGIFQFNVESEPELLALNEVAVSKNKRAAIAVRVNPDVDPKTHAKISTGQKESKFGIPMKDALPVYKLAATLPGINVQGVSMHIGSQLTSLMPFAEAFARLKTFVGELRAAGHAITTLDLGGGLGIPYGQEEPPLIADYAEIAKRETEGLGCKLIFEPGRLMVGNAGILVARVIYVKHAGSRIFVIVDAGMNDLIRPTLYEAYHEILPARESKNGSTITADIVGPVCETGDIFAESRELSHLPQAGDLLIFRTAGAYGASMASTYNARALLAEVMVNGSKIAVVHQRQSYDALLGAMSIPQWTA